ncbi:MAG TPA: penicillin-binding protein 1A, partial [Stellaceae bacterium]|nr:penicillin-binding protein 1A [Stellaceae bacterium]
MRSLTSIVRFLFVCAVLLAMIGGAVAGLTIWYFGRDLPDYQQLAKYQPPIATRVLAGDGRLLAEYATERRVFVPITAIPKRVIAAFLAAEDKNFYSHHGVDPISMLRAAVTDIGRWHSSRRPIGASTITQQVAKNMLLTNELSIQRKVKEVLLATRIDEALPKDRILELYLNEIYLGAGAYGVAAAALTYFDKPLDELTLGEAAFLAGLPKAPSNYNPVRFPLAARARRDIVLDQIQEAGFATPADVAAAKADPVTVRHREEAALINAPYFAEEVRRELVARFGEKSVYEGGLTVRTSLDGKLQEYSDKTLREGLISFDRAHGGWRGAVDTIDIRTDWWTKLAEMPLPPGADAMNWQLALVLRTDGEGAEIGFKDKTYGRIPFSQMRWAQPLRDDGTLGAYPRSAADVVKVGDVIMVEPLPAAPESKKPPAKLTRTAVAAPATPEKPVMPLYNLCQIPDISGAVVSIDPHTGRVLAMSGGYSFEISQFNRATQAHRQPGSAIKPFIYLTAMEHGFTPSTLVLDGPLALDQGPGLPPWTPGNYESEAFRGPTPLAVALAHSLNTVAARLGAILGMEPIGQNIEAFGIMDHMPREYSMTLGAGETTPLRLTTAYAMLADGGKKLTPTLIDSVQDRDGVTIYRADQRPCKGCSDVEWNSQPPPALPDTREQIADPASSYQVVQMMQGVVQRGTGAKVAAVGKPIAGKTGTTSEWRDAWFVGFTPNLAAGVYVGYDSHDSLGRGQQAAVVAAPMFRDFMMAALKDAPATEFRIPPGLQMVRVNPDSMLPAGGEGIWFAYKPGTGPDQERDKGLQGVPGEGSGLVSGETPRQPSSGTGG